MIHISLDIDTPISRLRVSITDTRLELRRSLLALQDGDGVVAAPGAAFASEHGAAVPEVVIQRRAAEVVGAADPLGHLTGDHGAVLVGVLDLGPARSQPALGRAAKLVLTAVTLWTDRGGSEVRWAGTITLRDTGNRGSEQRLHLGKK